VNATDETSNHPPRLQESLLTADAVVAAMPLLEKMPFPVLWIDRQYAICWSNAAAAARFGQPERKCYETLHGYDRPCDAEQGRACRSLEAARLGLSASALHVHRCADNVQYSRILSLPMGAGVLELHVPVDESYSRDSLTGLLNRMAIEQIARQNLQLLRRLGQPCAVMLIDLDHFKQINDLHGHAAGDAFLEAIGKALLRSTRDTDVVGRWGGDEFLVLMPGTDRRGASEKATQLLKALREVHIVCDGATLSTSASAGVWVGHPRASFESIFRIADQALYQAKAAGRDRFLFGLEVPVEQEPPRAVANGEEIPMQEDQR
jgi:diguanylate cyclase (GGDEF)-like protein